jgi:hypothetical protein
MENSLLSYHNKGSFGSQQFVKGIYFYPKPLNSFNFQNDSNININDLQYDPSNDAQLLYECLENNSNENLNRIIQILVNYSQYQLEKLNEYFNNKYCNNGEKNLLLIFKNQYPEDFYNLVEYIINNQFISDCKDIFNTVKSKNYDTLSQIICQSNPFRLKILRAYFNNLYNKDFDNFIKEFKDRTNFIVELTIKLLKGERNSNYEPNIKRCTNILEKIKEQFGEDFEIENRDIIIEIFIDSSPSDIQYIIENYNKDDDNNDFFIDNCDNFTNYELYLINSLYMSMINIEKYYAKEINLYQPKDNRFIRTIVNCYRHGLMENVKNYYQKEFKTNIENKLNGDNSNEFNILMKEIIGK